MRMSRSSWWLAGVVIVLVIRFASLSMYPLTDTTEARYGEVSRVMAASGNWITPQLEQGVPFWAKPPLSFWQGALSVNLLGTSELAVRLPMFLNILIALGLTYAFAKRVCDPDVANISAFILVTSVIGFITAGAVMTDPAMVAATTWAMVGFWHALEHGSRRWGYGFFIALALGFLAKGPVAWVLIGVPIVLWLTLQRRWGDIGTRLPLVNGTGLMLLLTIPWFTIAEIKTPGYLNYFFVGEHFQRFVDSGWTGDLYGTAHDEPRGTIWLFTLQSFAPWSIVALGIIAARLARFRMQPLMGSFSSLQQYLAFWCLWPSVFFTVAGNILATYVLPALPAFAILVAMSLSQSRKSVLLMIPALLLPLAVVFAGPLGAIERLGKRTQYALIQYTQQTYPDVPLAYVGKPPPSARFYTRGAAVFFTDIESMQAWTQGRSTALIAVLDSMSLPEAMNASYLGRWNKHDLYLVGLDELSKTGNQ